MDMTGEYRIAAPRATVWAALNDPDTLKACIPGCESLEKSGEEMTATVVAKIGPVKAKFAGKVRFENVEIYGALQARQLQSGDLVRNRKSEPATK